MGERRRETRFPVEWATCPNCGSENVYALHEPADADMASPAALRVVCDGCESVDVRAGMEWKVVTVGD